MYIAKKPFITQNDFEPFAYISENTNIDKLNPHIIAVQNELLQEALGIDFYTDLATLYERQYNVVSIVAGLTTQITLESVVGLQVGYYFALQDIEGTIANSLNDNEFVITNISGNTITINLDTIGLVYTASTGYAERFLSPTYKDLHTIFTPYLVYGSYLRYVPTSNLHQTPYGTRVKKDNNSEQASMEQIGLAMRVIQSSSDVYKKNLFTFLEANKLVYPLYVSSETLEYVQVGVSSIPIRGRRKVLDGYMNNKGFI